MRFPYVIAGDDCRRLPTKILFLQRLKIKFFFPNSDECNDEDNG